MSRQQTISKLKSELEEVTTEEQLFRQCLAVITSRKNRLKMELDSLGASNSARKSKHQLDPEKKAQLIASLTK